MSKKVEIIASAGSVVATHKKEQSSIRGNQAFNLDSLESPHNQNDIVGVMLRGEDLSTRIVVTFNRQLNTYYQNYNTSVISEQTLITAVWESLTDLGQVKMRNLFKFYKDKMPERLDKLRKNLFQQPTPTEERLRELDFNPIPIAGDSCSHEHHTDPQTILDYDLDNVHLCSVVEVVKADIDPTSNDDFVQTHNYLEKSLSQVGFSFLACKVKNADTYVYDVLLDDQSLTSLDVNNAEQVDSVTNALLDAISVLGWQTDDTTFPIYQGPGCMLWLADNGRVALRVCSKESTVTFNRIGAQ